MIIEAKVIKGVTQEILNERYRARPEYYKLNAEPSDNDCESFIFTCDGNLMAAGRICSSYNGPLFKQSSGTGFRSEMDTVDMQRFFIAPQFRGTENFYEFFVLSCFDYIIGKGFKYGQSSLTPGRHLQERLEKLHFEIGLKTVPLLMLTGAVQEELPVIVDFEKSRNEIMADLDKLKAHFEQQYTFVKNY